MGSTGFTDYTGSTLQFVKAQQTTSGNDCLKGTTKECLECGNKFSTEGNLEKHMIFSFSCGLIEDYLNSV